jgi:hypothetical protein
VHGDETKAIQSNLEKYKDRESGERRATLSNYLAPLESNFLNSFFLQTKIHGIIPASAGPFLGRRRASGTTKQEAPKLCKNQNRISKG